MKQKNSIALLILLNIILLLTTPVYSGEKGVLQNTIKVGVIADTTGPYADLGRDLLMGYFDYFKHINEKGGIHGRKIVLIHEDDQYKIPLAIAAFEKLVFKDEIFGLLHCGGTQQSLALIDKIQKEKLPSIVTGMVEPLYHPYKRYIFIYGSKYASQIETLIDYFINELKVKAPKMGIVYPPIEWGKEGQRASQTRLKGYGLGLVGEVELPPGAVDPSSQVLIMKNAGADHVIIFSIPSAAISVIKTAEKFNYFPTYLTPTWCADDSIIKAVGKAGEKFYSGSVFGSWHEDNPGGREVREIAKKYGSSPRLKNLYIQGYTNATLFVEGLKRAGRDLTVEKFVDALETFKEFDCGGMLCPMTYTSKAHNPSEYTKIFKADVEKQILIPATGWVKPKELK